MDHCYSLSQLEKLPAAQALPHYLDLLEHNPTDNRVFSNSIRVMTVMGRKDLLQLILPEAEQRLEKFPHDYNLAGAMMRGYCIMGFYMQAVELADSKLYNISPSFAFLNDCVKVYADSRQVAKANKIAHMLLDDYAHNPRAVRVAMAVFSNIGRKGPALEAAHRIMELWTEKPILPAMADAMVVYAGYAEEARALYCLNQLLPRYSYDAKVVLSAFDACAKLKKSEYLRSSLADIESKHHSNLDVMVNVANCYWLLREPEKAAQIMDSDLFKGKYPTGDHVLQGIDVLTKLERKEQAISWTDRLFDIRGRDHISMKFAATTYLCHQEAEKALRAIEHMEAVGKDPERANNYRYLAGIILRDDTLIGQAEEKMRRHNYDGRWVQSLKGIAAWYEGDVERATQAFASCLGETHKNITVLYLMAAPDHHPDRACLQQQMPSEVFGKLVEYAHNVRAGEYPLSRVALGYLPESQNLYRRERQALNF